jgi:hypothetical protein
MRVLLTALAIAIILIGAIVSKAEAMVTGVETPTLTDTHSLIAGPGSAENREW